MLRSIRYRLAPTTEQEAAFRQFSGVCRLVYNLAFEQRRDFWRQFKARTGSSLTYNEQAKQLTCLRAEFPFIAAVSQTCQQQALRDLDKAFANFFAGRADFPSPRRKNINESFRFQGNRVSTKRLNGKWSVARLPKIGWVKYRDTRPVVGAIINATVIRDALGWHLSFVCEIEKTVPVNNRSTVGIDRGVENTIALSNGELLSVPASLKNIELRHRRANCAIARCKKGSKRRLKAVQRAARLSSKRARIRLDWHHKAAREISERFGDVVIEDLKIANMTARAIGPRIRQKSGLNRSILNQGWYAFETILAYKLEERGGILIKVPAMYTSQTCSCCGTVDKKSRESQAVFSCQHCGHRDNADTNAAINILRGSTPSMCVEDSRRATVEARTGLDREVHENQLARTG